MNFKSIITRPAVWGSLVSIAIMAVVAIAFFYPDNFDGNVLKQDDVIQGISNGEEARAFQEATGETTRWTNSLFSGMPTFQISPSYPSDGLFKWVNKVFSLGLPGCSGLIMMMMLGMYIMLSVLGIRWYLALIGAIAWGFSSYYIIIIGAGHLWKFYTLTYVPPTIGGVIMAYRGRFLAGAALGAFGLMMQISWNHIQMTYYFMFVVALIAICYLIYAIREHAVKLWAKATGFLLVSAVLAVGANAPNLYFTSKYAPESIRGGHSELTFDKKDESASKGLDKEYITQYSYGRSETFTLLIPNVKGGASVLPDDGGMKYASLLDLPDAEKIVKDARLGDQEIDLLGSYSQYFGEPESTNGPVYIGAIICALFLLGCVIVKGPLKWALLAATILSILLAWGRNFLPLTDLFINIVPGYNKFRTPESILVIAQFAMPVLGILALRELFLNRSDKRVWKALYWTFGITAAFCFVGWVAPGFYGTTEYARDTDFINQNLAYYQQAGYPDEQLQQIQLQLQGIYDKIAPVAADLRHGMVAADSLRSLLFVILAGGAIFIGMKRDRKYPTFGVLGFLVLIDLYGVDKRYLNHDSFNKPVKQEIVAEAATRAILADTAMNYRVMPLGREFTNPKWSYFHKSVGGYHAAKLARYNDVINYYLNSASQTGRPNAVVDMLNAKYLIYSPEQAVMNPGALGNAWLVDKVSFVDTPDEEFIALNSLDPASEAVADRKFAEQLKDAAKAKAPGDTIYETSYAPNRLTYTVNTTNGGLAVFSEVYFPWGWEATIDGKPVEISRVNYILRAIPVQAGQHEIVMTFAPKAVDTTCTIATISALLIYLLIAAAIVWPIWQQRNARNKVAKK